VAILTQLTVHAEMIKEIVANIKTDDLEILFRMDSGYFDEKIIETIESLGCKYLIKAKSYSTLASHKQRIHRLYSLKVKKAEKLQNCLQN
jgi:hypothetical protein